MVFHLSELVIPFLSRKYEILSKARIAHELSSVSIAIAEYLLDNFRIVKKIFKQLKNREKMKKNLLGLA